MRIALITIAYNIVGATERMLKSVSGELWYGPNRYRSEFEVATYLFLHSNRFPEKTAECERLFDSQAVHRYYPYGTNRGLCRSWNEGLFQAFEEGAEAVVFANEDIIFGPSDFERLVETALTRRDHWLVSAIDDGGQSHSLAAGVYHQTAWRTLGCFDENFFPAYWEDADYALRAELAGLKKSTVKGTCTRHLGSACVRSDDLLRSQTHLTAARNGEYFFRKWGKDSDYSRPFDDPSLNFHIPFASRSSPYGIHDRTDREELGYETSMV
jgi:hypothetical protein